MAWTRRACVGCGRLLGLLALLECPCWRSALRGAVIPIRVRSLYKRVSTAYALAGRVATDAEYASALAICRKVNEALVEAAR